MSFEESTVHITVEEYYPLHQNEGVNSCARTKNPWFKHKIMLFGGIFGLILLCVLSCLIGALLQRNYAGIIHPSTNTSANAYENGKSNDGSTTNAGENGTSHVSSTTVVSIIQPNTTTTMKSDCCENGYKNPISP